MVEEFNEVRMLLHCFGSNKHWTLFPFLNATSLHFLMFSTKVLMTEAILFWILYVSFLQPISANW